MKPSKFDSILEGLSAGRGEMNSGKVKTGQQWPGQAG